MSDKPRSDFSQETRNLGAAMMAIRELSAPVEEAARGYRAELMTHGWSANSADTMACEWFVLVMRHMQAAATGSVSTESEDGS